MAKKKTRGPSPVIAERLKECRRQMRKRRTLAMLITNPPDYFYLIGFTGEDSAVLITPREAHLITDGRFDESSKEECPWARKWLRKLLLNDEIANVCAALKLRSLAVQPEHVTIGSHAALAKLARGTRLVKAPPITTTMRRIKSPCELTLLRKSIAVAEEAFEAMVKTIRVGQTEREMAARLEYEMKRRGASGPSFPTICAEGPNGALPHAVPGSRKVKRGSAVLFDWGARVGGYCSDLTRVIFVGSIPSKLREVYGVVWEAQQRAIVGLRPGMRMCDADAIARKHITAAGYGDAFNHGLGHGLGLDIHEAPSLSWRSKEKLEVGMVVTVEPGVYLPGVGGVRLEDDVLLTPTGCRVLTRLGRELSDAVIPSRG